MTKKFALWLILLAPVALYLPTFTTYFAGDDFFHFSVSRVGRLWDFARFFGFYPFDSRGVAFYRPLFREVLYGIYLVSFGLNVFPMRIFAMLLHIANIYLVYKVGKVLVNSEFVSLIAALFFGVSASNVGILYYLAGGLQAQGATLFMLLSLLAFSARHRTAAFILFLAGLASHEQAIVIPALLCGIIWLEEKRFGVFVKRIGQQLWPYLVTLVGYFYANIFVIGFSSAEVQYRPVFSLGTTLNTLAWYSAWALGLPEMLVDFMRPGLSLNPGLMRYWGSYFHFIFPAFFVSIGVLVIAGMSQLKRLCKDKHIYFLAGWFVAALLPVVFLPLHKKTYYLAPALPAFWLLVGYTVEKLKSNKLFRPLVVVLISSLVTLTVVSVKLSEKTYWAINRAKIAQKVVRDLKYQYPTLPHRAVLYIKNDPDYPFISESWGGTSTQTNLALSGADAIRLLYGDAELTVTYQDKDPSIPVGAIEFISKIE